MSEFVKIIGLEQIKAVFQRLPGEIARKILPKGTNAGAKLFRDAARSNVPVASGPVRRGGGRVTVPGTLRKAIVSKFLRAESNDTQAVSIVAVRKGKGLDAFYGRFVEFGHAKRGGGFVAGRRFMTRAFNANISRDITVVKDTLSEELNKLPEFRP